MDNERIREICLALPHVAETLNWGHHLVYWAGDRDIGGKMFAMTEGINKDYIAKIDSSGAPVTCGTCHRGHLGPEPFVAPVKDSQHIPQGPPPADANPAPAK